MWQEAIGKYVVYLKALDRSPGTIRLHRHYLGDLAATTKSGPFTIGTDQIVAWLAQHHWQPETRRSASSTIRTFCRWAVAMGHRRTDPTLRLPAVTVPSGVARPAPEQVLMDALAVADGRLRLMLLAGATAGLRCCEIARIHRDDLGRDGLLHVTGKGRKRRIVPLVNVELASAIRAADGWLFPNGRGDHLTPGHVSVLLSRALPDQWTAHTLRHRMATRAYAGTRDLLAVGRVLGHSKPETTQRYVQMPTDSLWDAVAAAA